MRSVRIAPVPVLLLILTLAASPALAAGGRVLQAESAPGLFAAVWQALGELIPWLGVTQAVKNGQTTSACSGELGSTMDPDGCPRSQNSSDSGSIMDPDG